MTAEEIQAIREGFATLPGIDDGRPGEGANAHVTLNVAGGVWGGTPFVFVVRAANLETFDFMGVKCGEDGIVPAHAAPRLYRIVKGPDGNVYVLGLEQGRPVGEPYSLSSY